MRGTRYRLTGALSGSQTSVQPVSPIPFSLTWVWPGALAADNLNANRLRNDAAIGGLRLSAFDAGDHIRSVTIEVVRGTAQDRAGIEPRPHGGRRRRRRWRRILLLDQQAGSIQRHTLCQ